jgi:hypothetical protein
MEYLDYERLFEQSLLTTVKEVLLHVKKDGLREPHHFYITFLTQYPGVELPGYLGEEYPKEITIVLQYQFWDLDVQKDHFSVVLSFNDQDEKIRVPYKALISFSDPSQNFSLEFNPTLPKKVKSTGEKKSISSGPDDSQSDHTPPDEDNIVSIDQFRKK